MGSAHTVQKVLTKEEWESMKSGMSDEFSRLRKDVGESTKNTAQGVTEARLEPPKPVVPMNYVTTHRVFYVAGAGVKDGDFYFHFFPATDQFRPDFADKLGDAFIRTFKNGSATWDYVPEMNHPDNPEVRGSWVVKVPGYGDKPLAYTLVSDLFIALDKLLEI